MCDNSEDLKTLISIAYKIYSRIPNRTQFATIQLPVGFAGGIPLGQGKCLGVQLQLNIQNRNTTSNTPPPVRRLIYYGDEGEQNYELTTRAGDPASVVGDGITFLKAESDIIWCRDLNEVYVRTDASDGNANVVQVKIFLGDSNVVEFNPDLNPRFS